MLDLSFSFSCFSILGWLMEVAYRSVRAKRFVKPGLLKGPYLILYGSGALILMGTTSLLRSVGAGVAVKALVYFAITTGFELLSGEIAQRLFQATLWDYSNERFQYKGLICLKYSMYWLVLAYAFDILVLPSYHVLLGHIPTVIKGCIAWFVLSLILVDLLATAVRTFFTMSAEEKALVDEEFWQVATPILALPDVMKLSQYPHHRRKTRLDHVKEVAYLSFRMGRRLSLDGVAIIRGALLHDLFFYDWMREGPRLHGLRHPAIALNNARRITHLSNKEEDIIKKHMWPLTIMPPQYPDSLVVSLVDSYCSILDYMPSNIYIQFSNIGKTGTATDLCVSQEEKEKIA